MLPWYEFSPVLERAGFGQEVAFFTGEVLSASDDLSGLISVLDLDGELASVFHSLAGVEGHAAHLARHSHEAARAYRKALQSSVDGADQKASDSAREALAQKPLTIPAPVFGPQQPSPKRFLSLHAAFTNATLAINLFRGVWQSWQASYAPAQAILPAALAAATLLQLVSKAAEREATKTADMMMSDPELSFELETVFQKECQDGLAQNPLDWELWLNLAESLMDTHELAGAREAISKALALSPQSPWAYQLAGRLDRLKGDLDGAMANLSQATKLDPRDGDAWAEIAEVLVARGEIEQASKVVRKLDRLDVDRPLVRQLRAKIQAAKSGGSGRRPTPGPKDH